MENKKPYSKPPTRKYYGIEIETLIGSPSAAAPSSALSFTTRLGAVRVAAAQLQRLLQLRQRRRGTWKMQKTHGDPGENGRKLLV